MSLPMSQSYSSSPRSAHVVRASLPKALRRLLVVSGCLFFALLTLSYYLRWERIEPNKLSQSVSQWRNKLGHLSSYSSESQHRSPKPKAAFVALVRERNLDGMLQTMQDLQLTFNDHPDHGYDYVFLSEEPFTDWFKDHVRSFLSQTQTKPQVHFGIVPKDDWDIPSHIDIDRAKRRWKEMKEAGVVYGGSKSYRQMCRFYSGPIFNHPLVRDLEYYWRVEPDTRHLCRIVSHWRNRDDGTKEWVERDPFRYMRDHKKKYAFTISMLEYRPTIISLMAHVNKWRRENAHHIAPDNLVEFISKDGSNYNRCHFWSNFEIVDVSFFRSEAYQSLFRALDLAGGFFYQRWGDAPVHSIAASLLLNKQEFWHIDFAGYRHAPYQTCPYTPDPGARCACDPQTSFEYDHSHASCQSQFDKAMGRNVTQIVHTLNEINGEGDHQFKEEEEPYVVVPKRLLFTL